MRSTAGVFEAMVTYGSACWADTALGVQMNRKNLLRAQRTALLTVCHKGIHDDVRTGAPSNSWGAADRPTGNSTIYYSRLEGVGKLRAEREARAQSMERWQHSWDTGTTGRWTYQIWPDVKERVSERWFRTNHYVTQFASGHGNFRQKLHSFALAFSPVCPLCEVDDTLQHALLVCDVTAEAREALEGDLLAAGLTLTVENIFRTAEGNAIFRQYARQFGQIREDYDRELLRQLEAAGLVGA